jgi:hypothetical protein
MPEEMIVRYCAPTLAGIKTGSLFSCPCGSRERMLGDIREFNRRFREKGLVMLAARFSEKRALLYLFRPGRLAEDLRDRRAAVMLEASGYEPGCVYRPLADLFGRLRKREEFPHEIGLFLGYPPEDVKGFMENRAANCKATGLWKVYGDVEAARRVFVKYKKCTELYTKRYRSGCSLELLAVTGGSGKG